MKDIEFTVVDNVKSKVCPPELKVEFVYSNVIHVYTDRGTLALEGEDLDNFLTNGTIPDWAIKAGYYDNED